MGRKDELFPHVIPEIEDWPIYKLHQNRPAFVKELVERTVEHLYELKKGDEINELIAKAIYAEKRRIKNNPWKVDPPDDKSFWKNTQERLEAIDIDDPLKYEKEKDILTGIVTRFAEEIVGTFKKPVFKFSRKFLRFFFRRLLNSASGRNWARIYSSRFKIGDRIKVKGSLDKIRKLSTKGTIVILPTHFSNLDSILIGYAIDTFTGLAAPNYGAGLNLFNSGAVAYFMNRLGAYRVDRRKKNMIYLETLKLMSNLAIQKDVNSIFFPGGTRSRDGALESKLKLGLLGTVFDAQREHLMNNNGKKVFIVPLVISYPVVLEAKQLIEQYLKQSGREKYMKSGVNYYALRRVLKFVWKIFSKGSNITLSFGEPLDVFGNFVNDEGISQDKNGQRIEIKDYFMSGNKIVANAQRDMEYTKLLAEKIVERFHAENIVLSSHIVAFAAYRLLQKAYPKLDIFDIVRIPVDKCSFEKQELIREVDKIKSELIELKNEKRVKLSEMFDKTTAELVDYGVSELGVFHVNKPLYFDKEGKVRSDDFRVLYFYHNRLNGYTL